MVTRVSGRSASSYRFDINDLVLTASSELSLGALSVEWQCGRHSTTTPLMPVSRRRFRIDQPLTLICSIKRNRPRLAMLKIQNSQDGITFGRFEIDLSELSRMSPSQSFITRDYRLNDCSDPNATVTIRITTEALTETSDKFSVDGDFAIELQKQLQDERRAKRELMAQVDDLTARLFQDTLRNEELLKKSMSDQQNQVASLSQSSEGEIRLLRQKLADQKVRFEARALDDAQRIRNEEEAKTRELLSQQMERFQEKLLDLETQKTSSDATSKRYKEEAERLRQELNEFAKKRGQDNQNEIVAVKDKILGRRILSKDDKIDLNSKTDSDGVDLVLLEKVVQSMKQNQDVLIQKQRAKNISEQAKNRAAAAAAALNTQPSAQDVNAAPVSSGAEEKLLALKNELKTAQEEAANQAKKAKMAESAKLMIQKQLELEKKWRETLQKQLDENAGGTANTEVGNGSKLAAAEQALEDSGREIMDLKAQIKQLEKAKSDATRLESDVQRLQAELNAKSSNGANTGDVDKIRTSLFKSQEECHALERSRDALQADLRQSQAKLDESTKQVQVEQGRRQQLQKQLDQGVTERSELDAKIKDLTVQIALGQQKFSQAETNLEQLRQQIADLSQQLEYSRAVAASTAPAEMVSAVKKERDLLLDRAQTAELNAAQLQGQLDRATDRISELNNTIAELRESNAGLNRDLKRAMEKSDSALAKALELQRGSSPVALDRVWERRARDAEEMLKMAQESFAETAKILEDRTTALDEELIQTRQRLVSISEEVNRKEDQIESLKKKLQEGFKERMDMNEYLNDLEIELANNKARFVDTIDELSNLENENLRLRDKLAALGIKITPAQRSQPRFTDAPSDLP